MTGYSDGSFEEEAVAADGDGRGDQRYCIINWREGVASKILVDVGQVGVC